MSYSPYNRNASGVLFLGSSGSDAKFESRSNFSFNATNGTLGVPVIALSNNVSVSGIETTLSSANNFLATSSAVKTYVDQAVSDGFSANDAMVFKGTLGSGGTETTLPPTYNTGWTFKVITAGTYAGKVAEVGDMYVALVTRSGSGNQDSDWAVVQANIDGAVTGPVSATSGNFPIFNNDTGKVIANSNFSPSSFVLASDTTVVRTTGNQTIGGNKTFTGTVLVGEASGIAMFPLEGELAVGGTILAGKQEFGSGYNFVANGSSIQTRLGFTNSTASHFAIFTADPLATSRHLQTRTASQVKGDIGLGNVQNIALSGVQIIAGSGLVGGGSIDSTKTLNVGGGNGITVSNTGIAVKIQDGANLSFQNGFLHSRPVLNFITNDVGNGYTAGVAVDDVSYNPVDSSLGTTIITLPVSNERRQGHFVVIKKIDSTNNTVTITGGGTSTIDGATSKVLYYQYETLTMISDGTNWFIV
jgi:hypothetical protein